MDLDKALVAAIIKAGSLGIKAVREEGLTPDLLTGEGKKGLEFLYDYASNYGGCPDLEVTSGKLGIDFSGQPEGNLNYYIDEIYRRRLHTSLQIGISEILGILEERDPDRALEDLSKLARELRKDQRNAVRPQSITALGNEVKALYDRIKSGETGILSPWSTLNDLTLGFWPQDLVLFVARMGIGKSWVAIQLARQAWLNGHKVLFATTEMSKVRIACRFYSIHYQLPYGQLTKGRLATFAERTLEEGIESLQGDENFQIIGGDFDFNADSLEAAIDDLMPEVLVLDGAYLLRTAGSSRTEKAANAFDELKRIANRKHIPVVITHQFNREVKANQADTVRPESIALTDAGGWNSDLIFALIQTEDMKADKRLTIKSMKVREGTGQDIDLRWDFDMMDFSELPRDGGGGGDADEFGADLNNADDVDEDVPF